MPSITNFNPPTFVTVTVKVVEVVACALVPWVATESKRDKETYRIDSIVHAPRGTLAETRRRMGAGAVNRRGRRTDA